MRKSEMKQFLLEVLAQTRPGEQWYMNGHVNVEGRKF